MPDALASPTWNGKTHVVAGYITYCGRLTTNWVFFNFGGDPDCRLCQRTVDRDRELTIAEQLRRQQ